MLPRVNHKILVNGREKLFYSEIYDLVWSFRRMPKGSLRFLLSLQRTVTLGQLIDELVEAFQEKNE